MSSSSSSHSLSRDSSVSSTSLNRPNIFELYTSSSSASPSITVESALSDSFSTTSDDGDTTTPTAITDCARSLMTLVRDIYADFPDLASPSGLFVSGSEDYLQATTSSETLIHEEENHRADVKLKNTSSAEMEDLLGDAVMAAVEAILDELEQLAYEVRMMSAPTPGTLSPVTPQEATFASWQHVNTVNDKPRDESRTSYYTSAYSEESGYDSGPSSPCYPLEGLDSEAECDATPRSRRPVHDSRRHLPKGLNTMGFLSRPLSPQDVPLPSSPLDLDFSPRRTGSPTQRSRFRPLMDVILRHKRSQPFSPTTTSFGKAPSPDRAKGELRKFRSLLFKESSPSPIRMADTPLGRKSESFLDF